jgi:phosphoesterase RecJ-like protein
MNIDTSKYIKELSEELKDTANIVVMSHNNPDGDAIGSVIGLAQFLKKISSATVTMVSPDSLPGFLRWMKGADEILCFDLNPGSVVKHINEADLIVCADFNDYSRLGGIEKYVEESRARKVLIDHHPDPVIMATVMVSEPSFSSTAEIVFRIASDAVPGIISDITFSEAIFTGIMTDTGNFNFGSFDGDTLRIIAVLLDNGLKKEYITEKIYNNFSASRMRLMGYALNEKMVVMPAFHTAYIYLSKSDLDRYNFKQADSEGFVNMPLTIDGIIFSVLFLERGDHVKLSLRSRSNFPVNRFASLYFSGGGHMNAAGGKSPVSLDEALEYFESLLPLHSGQLKDAYLKTV